MILIDNDDYDVIVMMVTLSQIKKDNDDDYICMCSFSVSFVILITAYNDLQLQQHYSLHIHIIDCNFSSYTSTSSSYTLQLCIPLSTYHYFPPHLTITPSFLLIYFSVYYFLQENRFTPPLYIACEKGYESTVLVLLQNKADPNLHNEVTSRRMIDYDSRW